MSNTDDIKALGRRWQTDIWNAGSLSAALAAAEEIVGPEFADHSRPPMLPDGLEGLKQQVTIFYTAFPDIWSRVEDVLAEGDRVVGPDPPPEHPTPNTQHPTPDHPV